MILPLALVERTPDQRYVDRNQDLESALKANVTDAKNIWDQLQDLYDQVITPETTKQHRKHNKDVLTKIRTREKWLDDLIKYSDYPALTMAAFPKSRFLARAKFYEEIDRITSPILARGIASGAMLDLARDRGLDYWFIETGYFGNYPHPENRTGRKLYHRIVKNAMQQQTVFKVPDDRWLDLCRRDRKLEYRGWRNNSGAILLVVPSVKPCKYYGVDQAKWITDTTTELQKYTDRPIVLRTKSTRWQRTQQPIYEQFDQNIYAVVTYNSIAAAEAVAYGIPAFALAPTAAKAVTSSDLSRIESPYQPDETFVYQWLCSLAYGQFHLNELVSGKAWDTLMENESRETINF